MTRTITRTLQLPVQPEHIWEQVLTPRLMQHIGRPMIRFAPVGGKPFPDQWSEGEHKVWLYLFGFVPLGWQVIGAELPPQQGEQQMLRDNGYSPMIKRWDHRIIIEPEGTGTRYTDMIEIEAGLLTPLVAWGADIFFAHRQRRLLKIAQRGFRYPD